MRSNWKQTQISSCQSPSSEHKYIFAIMARAITIMGTEYNGVGERGKFLR